MYSKPDESFSVGDIVEWNDNYFLVIDIDEDQQIQTKGVIQLCNNTLNMYIDDILYEIPCIVESNTRLYQLGTDDNKFISEPSTNIIVRVPKNSISLLIERDQIYQLGVNNYKIVDISDIIEQGLLVFKLEFSQEEQHIPVYSIDILNGTEASIQNSSTLQLNVQVKKDSKVLSSSIPSINYKSSNTNICSVDNNGLITAINLGNCVISVSLVSDSSVSDSINIDVVSVEQNNYTYILTSNEKPDTEIMVNKTKIYTVRKYNNGIPINQAFTIDVLGDGTVYKLDIIDSNTCSIKALKAVNTITLNATDNNDITKVVSKRIQLSNWF